MKRKDKASIADAPRQDGIDELLQRAVQFAGKPKGQAAQAALLAQVNDYRTRIDRLEAEQFQPRVDPWMSACFGEEISADREERNYRFLEEALELVQACGCPVEKAHALVDYVFNRPADAPFMEVGGVMITLAALCRAQDINMHDAGEAELTRVWTLVDKIRAKHRGKPIKSPSPTPTDENIG